MKRGLRWTIVVCISVLATSGTLFADHGFEDGGFADWRNSSATTVFDVNPYTGTYHAFLACDSSSYGTPLDIEMLEAFLGVKSGALDAVIENTETTDVQNGSAIIGEFFLEAGTTIRFAGNFLFRESPDNHPWNDSAFSMVKNSAGEIVVPLSVFADTFSEHQSGSTTEYPEFGTYNRTTGYLGLDFTAHESDTYFFAFAVANVGDAAVNPALLIDAVIDPIATVVQPSSQNTVRGINVGGTLESILGSDDEYLSFQPGFTFNSTEPPVWLEFEGQASARDNPSMEFVIESYVNTPSVEQRIELYNYMSGEYEQIYQGMGSISDVVLSVSVEGDITRFIDPESCNVKAQSTWKATGFVILFPWTVNVDEVKWILGE